MGNSVRKLLANLCSCCCPKDDDEASDPLVENQEGASSSSVPSSSSAAVRRRRRRNGVPPVALSQRHARRLDQILAAAAADMVDSRPMVVPENVAERRMSAEEVVKRGLDKATARFEEKGHAWVPSEEELEEEEEDAPPYVYDLSQMEEEVFVPFQLARHLHRTGHNRV